MNKKKVVLQCSCHFTRMGLDALINSTQLSESLEIIANPHDVEQCESLLSRLPVVDIVILTLRNGHYSLASLLDLIGEQLPKMHPFSQVVLMGDIAYIDVLKCCFNGLKNVWMILDPTTPLDKLQKHLQDLDFAYQQKPSDYNREVSTELSNRELMVLQRFLNGESPSQIADNLALHYKTISHYKRTALAKLGVRSLCPLVVNLHNRHLTHRSLLEITKRYYRLVE